MDEQVRGASQLAAIVVARDLAASEDPATARRWASPTQRVQFASLPCVAARVATEMAPMLEGYGVPAVLALLNARTRYRFTGVYRVEPPLLRNLCLYDRENPSLDASGDVQPLHDTYCGIVAVSAAPFVTAEAPTDRRVETHPRRDSVLSYLGVPIRDRGGRVLGTLCHFDCRPRLIPAGESEVLASIAASFAERLLAVPPQGAAPTLA